MNKLFLSLFFLPFLLKGQTSIEALSIIDDIQNGKAVSYKNVKITGVIDLTELQNQRKKGYNEYESSVEVPISFENCVFENDIIAYKNTEDRKGSYGLTYTTDFSDIVTFMNCKFQGSFFAKYSIFKEAVNFEGSFFTKEANFKYAKFKERAVFGNVDFRALANFKYAKFKADADFFQNAFGGEANFKYADFDERATFKRAVFSNFANFKYAEFDREGVFVNADFQGEANFKYTEGKVYKN